MLSQDTEILTKEGWKNHNQLRAGEDIFSFNLNKNIIERDKISEVETKDFQGELINIKNTYLDCLFTPDHKDFMNIAHIKIINDKRVSSVWDNWKLLAIDKFLIMPNKRLIKKKVSGIFNGEESIGKEKAQLLGWILTDGCMTNSTNGRRWDILIIQSYDSNRRKCEIIKELLTKAGLKFTENLQKPNPSRFNPNARIMVFRISSANKENINWILHYLNPKKKPKFNLLNLKNEELQEVLKGLMLGDGSANREFTAQNKELKEFFQILCIFTGKRCLMGKGKHNVTGKEKSRIWLTQYNEINVLPKHIKKMQYNGLVWCPVTNNGTVIAKRNNQVFITGTHAIEKGIDITRVQVLAGHSNIATTSVYTHLNPKIALDDFGRLF